MRRRMALVALALVGVCGQAHASTPVSPGQAPYTVLIVTTRGDCTGTLIDPSHVLTAADCAVDATGKQPLAPKDFGVLAGTGAPGLPRPEAQKRAVTPGRGHPGHNPPGAADAALP